MSGLIYVPKRELIVPLSMPVGMRGMYKIEAVNMTDGRRRVLADWFPNLITTNGADLLGNNQPLLYCSVGSGNRTPALTDTALQSLVATTNTLGPLGTQFTSSGSSPWFGQTTTQYAFAQGTATGNLSEVGVGASNTGNNLFSRALILDGSGNPTTITVLSTEALYVTYQLNQYSPSADVTGNVTIAGTVYAYVLRASRASSSSQWAYANGDSGGIENCMIYSGAIGAVTSLPSGASASNTNVTNNPYSTGSYTLSGTASWGLTSGNFGGTGVTAAEVFWGTGRASRGSYQISFSNSGNGIPKDSSHNLTLSFSTSWVINSP